ncbi:Glycosyltransferase family 4 protein [Candidatus Bealeia paramacronuclearis]|uniref:Glycosyltransferase family 4 protein n=1 Tax=Candidatus Bealeia paramacronuclearis TaxID=1921001 RepID=A0ABZ2C8B9_9PROT|nr:Glycosyltransferase family 4 protein [Candidatus Bealeia paramacronuclearis]
MSLDLSPYRVRQEISKFREAPRILQVLPALKSGGVEIGTLQIARAIQNAGGEAFVASSGGPLVERLESYGARHIPLNLEPRNPITIARNVRKLRHILEMERIDIVHVRSRAPAWSVYKAARQAHIPLVTTYHAPYNAQNVLKRFYNSVMAKGDRVIAISEFVAAHILKEYGNASWFHPENLRIVQRAVDLDLFNPYKITAQKLKNLRAEWNISEDHKVILLPARLTRWKGQEVLIRALSLLKSAKMTVVLVGSDQGRTGYRQELEKLVQDLDIQGRVKFVGHCEDMPAAFLLSDLVISTSTDPEGFGRVMAEALAMGRPVVGTRHGGALEIIQEGLTGWYVPPQDPEALAQVIEEAFALPQDAWQKMQMLARESVIQRFSLEKMCRKTLGVYEELL